jgi:hypothetical protein
MTGSTHASTKQGYGYMHAQWLRRLYTAQGHFEYTEKVLALREVMLRVLCAEDMSSTSTNDASVATSLSRLTSHIRDIVDTSREANNHTSAFSALHRAYQLCNTDQQQQQQQQQPNSMYTSIETVKCQLSEANACWSKGDSDRAIRIAKTIAAQLSAASNTADTQQQQLLAESLCMAGSWMSVTKSESSQDVLDSYLRRAVDLSQHNATLLCATHLKLADYVAALYVNVKSRVESAEWKASKRVSDRRDEELLTWQGMIDRRLKVLQNLGAQHDKDPEWR